MKVEITIKIQTFLSKEIKRLVLFNIISIMYYVILYLLVKLCVFPYKYEDVLF